MRIFYLTLSTTYIFCILARVSRKKYKILSGFFILLVALILICVSGLRNNIGDTFFYAHSYKLLSQNPSNISFEKDIGFSLINLLLMKISSNPQILIFTMALVTNGLNILELSKNNTYIELEIFMYITSGYYLTTMNGMRQCFAAALIFICTDFIVEENFKKYFIYIVLISFLHQSALIMIPMYFVVREKAWSKKVIIFIVIALITIISYNQISTILFKVLENTNYSGYAEFNEGGSSFLRTIINAIPVCLAFLKRKELEECSDKSNILVNMSIINLIFVSFGMYNWIFNRFGMYLQLYNFILLPMIIKECFKGKERRIIYFAFIILYFALFYVETDLLGNVRYMSDYKINELLY